MTDVERVAGSGGVPDWRDAAARADARVELAAVRTGLALERARMSADRTLMAVMRTGLGLIGVGFAIFEYFHVAQLAPGGTREFSATAARNVAFARASRGLAPPAMDVPGSVATTLAALFFALGLVVIIRTAYRAGLFG